MRREPRLTDRQLEIIKLLAEGLDSKEIAERLSIAKQTVKNHLYIAFRSIGAVNRPHAVAILYERGWLNAKTNDSNIGFAEYVHRKYPGVDEDIITMIQDILEHPKVAPKVGERPRG